MADTERSANKTESVYRTMLVYAQYTGLSNLWNAGLSSGDKMETTVCDLLADVMHLCDEYGLDFDELQETAARRYKEEMAKTT